MDAIMRIRKKLIYFAMVFEIEKSGTYIDRIKIL